MSPRRIELPVLKIAAQLRDGATLAAIGRQYGVSAVTVRRRVTDVPPAVKPPPVFIDLGRGGRPWLDYANCAQTDPEAFHPEKGGSTAAAKRICARCDVTAECLAEALATDERHGIRGGLSERERRKLKRGTA